MARFQEELPSDLIKEFEGLEKDCKKIFGEMAEAGARVVHANVLKNMKNAFESTRSLEKGLKITKIYHTPSDDAINVFVGFYGYDTDSKPTQRHPKGTPIELIALAREYGTSITHKNGKRKEHEAKKPFLRKSFKKKEIEDAMQKVQDKYIKGD